jgi:hypothetical protein
VPLKKKKKPKNQKNNREKKGNRKLLVHGHEIDKPLDRLIRQHKTKQSSGSKNNKTMRKDPSLQCWE